MSTRRKNSSKSRLLSRENQSLSRKRDPILEKAVKGLIEEINKPEFFDDHNPPHIHVEYSGAKAKIDFQGNILKGTLKSRTALRLVREWVDLHNRELEIDWELAKNSRQIRKIEPLK